MKNNKIYPWLVVGMLWFVALLNYLDRQMLSTMKPSMMIDIPELVSAQNFGRLMAVFLWIYAFMSPISGIIADRLNRKWLIVGSLFVWSGVTLLMGYATTFDQIYALRAIMGVSEAFYIPAGLSLIADYHQGKTRSFAIGIHTTGIYLGQAFGGFGATIAADFSWQFTFHSFGLLGMVYSLMLLLFLKEKKVYVPENTNSKSILAGFLRYPFNFLGEPRIYIKFIYADKYFDPEMPSKFNDSGQIMYSGQGGFGDCENRIGTGDGRYHRTSYSGRAICDD